MTETFVRYIGETRSELGQLLKLLKLEELGLQDETNHPKVDEVLPLQVIILH